MDKKEVLIEVKDLKKYFSVLRNCSTGFFGNCHHFILRIANSAGLR